MWNSKRACKGAESDGADRTSFVGRLASGSCRHTREHNNTQVKDAGIRRKLSAGFPVNSRRFPRLANRPSLCAVAEYTARMHGHCPGKIFIDDDTLVSVLLYRWDTNPVD